MLHVYAKGALVASINRQHKGADTYRASEPWLLLHKSGRVDRFETLAAAKDDVRKLWAPVQFKHA